MGMVSDRTCASLGAIALALAAALPTIAWAQSATPSRSSPTDAQTPLAEPVAPSVNAGASPADVVVTARKREERLQDTPISITALTSAQLTERGLRDALQVSQFTPGFQFENFGGRHGNQGNVSRPVIRGQSNILGDGNAAFFVDGILYSDSILSFPFDLVERIEIIKGPQAALFGRSTLSGAINLVTKQPTNTPEYTVNARAAEYNDYEINGLARGPIVADKLFYILQGRYYNFGGQYTNRLDGRTVGQQRSTGVNGGLDFRPNDQLLIRVNAGYNHDNDGASVLALQDRFANNCFLRSQRQYYCGPIQIQDSVNLNIASLNGQEGIRKDTTRVFGTIRYDFGPVTLTSNTGAFFTNENYGYDADYTDADPTNLVVPRSATDSVRTGANNRVEVSRRREWSTELRLTGDSAGPFRWTLGGFYYKRRRSLVENHFLATAPAVDFGTDRVDNIAGFGSVSYNITPQLAASAELRYAVDTIGNYQLARVTAIPGSNGLLENKYKSWLPRFTLDYHATPDVLLYGIVSKGNKPGAINSDPRTPVALRFADEESAWNYEVGVKSSLLDRALVANLALYYIDWSKQQLTSSFDLPGGGTAPYLLNAGKTVSKGFEIELSARVSPRFNAGLSYAYNDAHFLQLTDAEALDLFGNASVAGKQLPNTSKHQVAGFVRHRLPLTDSLALISRADASLSSRKYDQVYNLAYTGDKLLANLKLGLETPHFDLTFFVDNVTDNRTPSTVLRYVDQRNLNVVQNANPAQNNVAGSTTTERAFQYPLADKRRFGATLSARF